MGGYRRTDPETSKWAFEQMIADGSLSRRRLEIVQWMHDKEDATAGQIAEGLRRNRNNVATRLTELEYMEVVEKVREVPCPVSGKTCWTWQMTGKLPKPLPPSANGSPTKEALRVAVSELEDLYRLAQRCGNPFSGELIEVCHWLRKKAA